VRACRGRLRGRRAAAAALAVNKHVGLCGKRLNKKNDTLIFTDNDEAMHYFDQLGGKEHDGGSKMLCTLR